MSILLVSTWTELLRAILSNPVEFLRGHMLYILVFVLVLFGLSRLNNQMEIRSVNRAISIARAAVGSLMAFIIAPIILMVAINLLAIVKGIEPFSFWFIWDWLKLTASSFWWLIKSATCFTCNNVRTEYAYDLNALIRLAWICIPLIFIWLRAASTGFARLLILPVLVGIFFVTYGKKAAPTFFNKNIPAKYQDFQIADFLNWNDGGTPTNPIPNVTGPIADNRPSQYQIETDADRISPRKVQPPTTNPSSNIRPKTTTKPTNKFNIDQQLNRGKETINQFKTQNSGYFIALLFGFFLLAGLFSFFKFRKTALLFLLIGILGFIALAPDLLERPHFEKYQKTEELLNEFERLYEQQSGRPSVKLTNLAVEINNRLTRNNRHLPTYFCDKYKDYFYDRCVTRANYDY